MRRKWKCVLVIIVIGFSIIGLSVIGILYVLDNSITTLRTTSGYVFEISIPKGLYEGTVPIECTVTKNGETIFSERIGSVRGIDLWKHQFTLIESGEEHEVVAIVEQTNPHIVIAIYDVKKRTSWKTSKAVRKQLLERLEHSTGKSFFWPGEFEVEPRVYH
jgi:hypothetical protein